MHNLAALYARVREVIPPDKDRQFTQASALLNDPRLEEWLTEGAGYRLLLTQPGFEDATESVVRYSWGVITGAAIELAKQETNGATSYPIVAHEAGGELSIASPAEAHALHTRIQGSLLDSRLALYLQWKRQGWRVFCDTFEGYCERLDTPAATAYVWLSQVENTLYAHGLSPSVLLTHSLFSETANLPKLLPVAVSRELAKLDTPEKVREVWQDINARTEYTTAIQQAAAIKHIVSSLKFRGTAPPETPFDRDNAAQGAVDGFMDATVAESDLVAAETLADMAARHDTHLEQRLADDPDEEKEDDPFEGDILPPRPPEDCVEMLTDTLAMIRYGEPFEEIAVLRNLQIFYNEMSDFAEECVQYRQALSGTWAVLNTHQRNVLTNRDPRTGEPRFSKRQVNAMPYQKAVGFYETFLAARKEATL